LSDLDLMYCRGAINLGVVGWAESAPVD